MGINNSKGYRKKRGEWKMVAPKPIKFIRKSNRGILCGMKN